MIAKAAAETPPEPQGPPPGPAIISRSTGDRPLFDWTDPERETILRKSAVPYLAEIRDRCGELLDRGSLVLLLTARSFASAPWDYESDRRYPRPQLGIGAMDGKRTPRGLAEFIGRTFKAFGLWPELDRPHRGAWAPPEHAGSPRLLCCTVSFRRDLYMDERTGRLLEGAGALSRVLRTVFGLLEDELDQVVKVRYRRRHPPKPPSMVIKASPKA
ncbi:MAG: N-formylglutamate amidohydrolase [Deltaproteobacteria bacterium]|nr:N-formylglutamate amidohydrolase [Deltaproteobacteria bacterium]